MKHIASGLGVFHPKLQENLCNWHHWLMSE